MKTFKLFDTREQTYLTEDNTGKEVEFPTYEEANEYRFDYLSEGNYPDYPVTVIEVREV